MIYLIFGEDSLSVDEMLASIIPDPDSNELYDVNTTTLNGADTSLPELEAAWSAMPFIADKRTVIVRSLLSRIERPRASASSRSRSIPPEWANLAERLANVPPSTDLIFLDAALNRSNPLLRAIRPLAQVHQFRLPSPRDMPTWVRQRAAKLNAPIEPAAISALVDAIGNDTRIIDMELQKLALYRSNALIRRQDVNAMVSYVREANIFAAVDAVVEGRAGIALRLVRQLLDAGQPPTYIITMIARQARLLILAKNLKARGFRQDEIGKKISISGYPLTKTMQQETRISPQRLTEIHRTLLETDLAIKTGAAEEEIALDALIVALSANNP